MNEPRAFLLEQFHDYLTFERGLSDQTVSAYGRDLRRWCDFVVAHGVEDPAVVTVVQLREWVFDLKSEGLGPSSIRRAQSAVRTYFGFLLGEGVIEADPTDRLAAPRVERRLPDFLTRDEVERFLGAPDESHAFYWRDRAILEFLYATGVRVSELVDLRLSALDLEEGFATVFGKGARERLVAIGAPALGALGRYLRDVRPELDRGGGQGRVFLNGRGRPIRRESIWAIVKESARRGGIAKNVSPHTLRHTFATHLVEGGADLAAVQELLGHADISSTQIYTHLDRAYLRDLHRKYHPRA